MKKFILTILLFISSFIFISCDMNIPTNDTLDSFKIEITNKTVSWNKYKTADNYDIYVNDNFYKNETQHLYYSMSDLVNGSYSIYVIAKNATTALKKSNNVILIVTDNEGGTNPVKDKNVNVLMINDTHGSFATTSYPGLGKVETQITELEKVNGDYIKISNGDIFQGSYVSNVLYGLPIVEALNEMEFDCFVLGNHDFDWGLDKIKAYKDGDLTNGELNMPVLGANIIDKSTSKIVDWIDPYCVKYCNNYKVGIIGVMGDDLESAIMADYINDYYFSDALSSIKNYTKVLRNGLKCDLVIVSIHDYDEELNSSIASLTGEYTVDGILCGHTHQLITQTLTRTDGKKIQVVENQDKNETVQSITYIIQNHEYMSSTSEYYYPSKLAEDSKIQALYTKYQSYITEGQRVIGHTNKNIYRDELGSYCINAMLDNLECDVAVINKAGVRESLYSGDITVEKVWQIYPFNNQIILVEMTGYKIKQLINSNSDFLYYSDISSLVNTNKYTLAVVDYVYSGAYYSEFNGTTPNYTKVLMRSLLLNYLDSKY